MKKKDAGFASGVDVIVIPRLSWVCENVFCSSRDGICSNWTNCMNCPERTRFLTFVLNDKKPSSAKWGRRIIDASKG